MPKSRYTDISKTNPPELSDSIPATAREANKNTSPGRGLMSALRSTFFHTSNKISVEPSQLRQPGEDYNLVTTRGKLPFYTPRQGIPCSTESRAWLGFTVDEQSGCIDHLGLESSRQSTKSPQYAEWRRVNTDTRQPFKTASNALHKLLKKHDAGRYLSDPDREALLAEGQYYLLYTLTTLAKQYGLSVGAPTCATTNSTMCHEHGFDQNREVWNPRRSVLRHGALFDAMWSPSDSPQTAVASKSTEDLDRVLVLRQGSNGCCAILLSDMTFADSEAHRVKPNIVLSSDSKTVEELCEELATKLRKKPKAWLRAGENASTFLEGVWPDLQASALNLLKGQVQLSLLNRWSLLLE